MVVKIFKEFIPHHFLAISKGRVKVFPISAPCIVNDFFGRNLILSCRSCSILCTKSANDPTPIAIHNIFVKTAPTRFLKEEFDDDAGEKTTCCGKSRHLEK